MNTREIAEEYRLSHWAGIMRERQESGLSIKAFCEVSGFPQNNYFYWQRKLREAACQHLLPSTEQGQTAQVIAPAGWAICGVAESIPREQSIAIEIGKCKIAATTNTDQELLGTVCRLLIGLC